MKKIVSKFIKELATEIVRQLNTQDVDAIEEEIEETQPDEKIEISYLKDITNKNKKDQ